MRLGYVRRRDLGKIQWGPISDGQSLQKKLGENERKGESKIGRVVRRRQRHWMAFSIFSLVLPVASAALSDRSIGQTGIHFFWGGRQQGYNGDA
jgi:hypothetical protein